MPRRESAPDRSRGLMAGLDDYGEFAVLAPLLVLLNRLRSARLDADLAWLLPPDVLPGVTSAYGLPVIRAAVDHPMLAHEG